MELGLRERQKRERRDRIEAAARTVFREKGYDVATTREIAARAGVSIGTLFAYAADKRELLAAVYRDELAELTERTFATADRSAPFLDVLMHVLEARYVYWSADLLLARHAVRETFAAQYSGTPPPAPEQVLREKLVASVAVAQRNGTLTPHDDPALIARVVLDIYLSENRTWLAERAPDLATGIERLRASLALALRAILQPG